MLDKRTSQWRKAPVAAPCAEPLMILFHLALLAAFSLFAFKYNAGRLFIGNDGPTMIALAREQMAFFGISSSLHSDMLQGIASLSLPQNLSLLPAYWLPLFTAKGVFAPAFAYTWFAAQLFLAVLLAGWNHGFSRHARYGAAWLLTILAFPYFTHLRIYGITATIPHVSEMFLGVAMMETALWRFGRAGRRQDFGWGVLFLCGMLILLLVMPQMLMMFVPFLATAALIAIIGIPRPEALRKAALVAIMFVIAAAAGWVEYEVGMTLRSSPNFFLDDMLPSYPAGALEYVSLLFHHALPSGGAGPFLFAGGALGALYALWRGGARRRAGIMVLAQQAAIIGLGAWVMSRPQGWLGPAPIYFEMPLFPFYALFTAYAAEHLLAGLWHYRPSLRPPFPATFIHMALAVAVVAGMAVHIGIGRRDKPRAVGYYTVPPASTALTDILEKDIALVPDGAFRGRVASLIPGQGFDQQIQYFSSLNISIGNDHQTTGLWLKSIPTLHVYNLLTPALYRLVRDFLTVPEDRQNRNWTNFSKVDLRLMKLLGVRYLLSPATALKGAVKRAEITPPGLDPLRLFEIKGANTAGISARRVVAVADVVQAEAALRARDSDLSTAIVINGEKETQDWVAADSSEIAAERGGFRVRASSGGHTLLILPIEFSRCLAMTVLSGTAPQLRRVDIALTGLVFDRQADVRLVAQAGPFSQPRCLMQDYYDFRAMFAGRS